MLLPRPLIPRLKLDINYADMLSGLYGSLVPHRNWSSQAAQAEASWDNSQQQMICLSVRSGFDLLLSALELPRGSEVLVSAVTILDMITVIRAHGLVPVPVDISPEDLQPDLDHLRACLRPATRMLVVAHLFGAHLQMEDLAVFAAENNLLLVEDCAQAFQGPRAPATPSALASMFSYGPIKTATALGGAVMVVRDPQILGRMRLLHANYPIQNRNEYLRRLLWFFLLKLISNRIIFGTLFWLSEAGGSNIESWLGSAVRAFSAEELLLQIRRRPCVPLVRLLRRRLLSYDHSVIASRKAAGEQLVEQLRGTVNIPGAKAARHSFWVFPINVAVPDVTRCLRMKGFDCTPGASAMRVVPDPDTGNPCNRCTGASSILRHIIYLPIQPGLAPGEITRLASALREAVEKE